MYRRTIVFSHLIYSSAPDKDQQDDVEAARQHYLMLRARREVSIHI